MSGGGYGKADAGNALLHDVDGGHDRIDDIRDLLLLVKQLADFGFDAGFRALVAVGQLYYPARHCQVDICILSIVWIDQMDLYFFCTLISGK